MRQSELLFNNILKTNGYSITKARRVVFLSLLDSGPVSIHELINRNSTINRSSIYRVLRVFEDTNIITRIQMGWKYKIELSEIFGSHHHHISCRQCGNITELSFDAKVEAIIDRMLHQKNFHAISHQIEATGICQSCYDETLKTPS